LGAPTSVCLVDLYYKIGLMNGFAADMIRHAGSKNSRMHTVAPLLPGDGLIWVNFPRTCNGRLWLISSEEESRHGFLSAPFRSRFIYFQKVQTHCYEAVDLDDLIRVRIVDCRVTWMELDDSCATAFQ
jgi:hypothetical protein